MTTDNPTPNDPTPNTDTLLTAYALGELTPGGDDHAAVEARLEHDADARAYVAEAKAIARQLAETLAKTDAPGLAEPQQRVITQAIGGGVSAPTAVKPMRPLLFRRPVLLAAALALAAGAAITTAVLLDSADKPNDRQTVRVPTPEGLAAVTEAMQKPLAVDYKDAKLADVLDAIHAQTGVVFDIEWEALKPRGIDRNTTITLRSDDKLPAGVVLAGALQRCWAQSPHPDPADWTATHAGVTIAPQSTLVQHRLDATRGLLAQRRFSQTPFTDDQLAVAHPDAWESDLWNRYLAKAKQADELLRALLPAEGTAAPDDAEPEGEADGTVRRSVMLSREINRPSPATPRPPASVPYDQTLSRGFTRTDAALDSKVGLTAGDYYFMSDLMRGGTEGRYAPMEGLALSTRPPLDGRLGVSVHTGYAVTNLYYETQLGTSLASAGELRTKAAQGRYDFTSGDSLDTVSFSLSDLPVAGAAFRGVQDGEVRMMTRREAIDKELTVIDKRIEQLGQGGETENVNALQEYRGQLMTTRDEARQTEPAERAWIDAQSDADALWREFSEASGAGVEPFAAGDVYALVNDNPFHAVIDPGREFSTFSVDVDTAAYTLVRRQLMQQGQLPVPGAVRIEEMVNYFDYGYDAPVVDAAALEHGVVTQASLEQFERGHAGFAPFATHLAVTDCPWAQGHQLVRIGIKGMEVAQDERPAAHLTFLIDVSGSMNRPNKLPLVKESLKLLLEKLNPEDRISMVVYAGASGLVLENASAADKAVIEDALDRLSAGGSTAGAEGIQLAYDVAQRNFIAGGVNRVILCTDGDFNVGVSDTDDLVALIKDQANPPADDNGARKGVYLSVLGYGMGNLNDQMMEPLTNAGNGHYAYIDSLAEATKVMYDQAGSTLVAIAKDVKVQVHFDASQVLAYRLIGYENRVLATEDFDNDKVDAGDIGAGHSVTALYEVVPLLLDDPGDAEDPERVVRELRGQIERLDEALALNRSLLSTASLTPEQSMKLAGASRLLEQEHTLACAVAEHLGKGGGKGAGPAVKRPAPAPGSEAPAPGSGASIPGREAPDQPAGDDAAWGADPFADGAMLAVKLRYKPVDAPAQAGTSRLIVTKAYAEDAVGFDEADEGTRFAAAVAGFGMVLRNSPHKGDADLGWVIVTADAARDHDPGNLKAQLVELARKARELTPAEADAEAAGEPAPGPR